MTEAELKAALEALAESWRNKPTLSDDYSEGKRYGELKEELNREFGVRAYIKQNTDISPTHYQVYFEN